MIAELCGALISSIWGACIIFKKKTPLFYRIIFLAVLACLMGNVYTLLFRLLQQPEYTGFHVGYLGYISMFFFLYSSYYGAINSLADGNQPELKKYRVVAGFITVIFFILSILLICFCNKELWIFIVVIPIGFTLYFATKLLIIPDVEMGIIKVLRPYNGVIIGLCICMAIRILSKAGSVIETVSSIFAGLLLTVCIPVARRGVRKWFI